MMYKFWNNIRKYFRYGTYSARAEIKTEVEGSYLNYLWLFLDPIIFMIIYVFVAGVVFDATENHFVVFIFIGISLWNYFNKTITASVKIIKNNADIVSKIYVPKYVLILQKSLVNLYKLGISFLVMIFFMYYTEVDFTINLLNIIPLFLTLFIFTFGLSTLLLHYGVFIEDLSNVVNLILRFMFYISGIFYSVEARVPEPYNLMLQNFNPVAYIIDQFRDVILDSKLPQYDILLMWSLIGYLMLMIGVRLIHKYENSYAKVI